MITFELQLQDMTRADLADLAKVAKIPGRSKMNKAQMIEALITAKADVIATQSEAVQVFYAEADAIAEAEKAAEIKPGRCLQRVGKVGANPTQCVKAHAHEDDHEDRFGETYGNHLVNPGADPLSPTAQAVLDANRVWEAAMTDAWKSEGTERQDAADAAYEAAEKALREAREAHHAARVASSEAAARAVTRAEQPRGSRAAKRIQDAIGLRW